jgi:ERCC4-type nuclease
MGEKNKMTKTVTAETVIPGTLYIDIREPPHFFDLFAKECPVPLEIVTLKTSDIVMEDVGFERKTIDDFVGSILGKDNGHEGRLFTQTERMIKEFRKQYVFVTGSINDYKGNVHKHCILGALARLLADGIIVCFGINNDEDFVYLVLKTLEKEGKLRLIKPKVKKQTQQELPKDDDVFVGVVD